MEVIVRVALPDRPGALARLARAIGDAGVDIAAVDVVEAADGVALDDLVVVVEDPSALRGLVDAIAALEGVDLVHAGPSRGQPGDAVSRLALGLESLLNGAMTVDDGIRTLVGGLLRADLAELVPAAEAPRRENDRVVVLPVDDRVLVVRRDYRFTDTERSRAAAIVNVCVEAAALPR